MRCALLLVSLAACYSPKVAEGVACAPPGTDRCPSGQVCVTRGGLEVCEPGGATGDSDASVDAESDAAVDGAPLPDGWWNGAYKRRRRIDVRAGANGAPAGYTLGVTFDHNGLVGAGLAKANGDDVRIVRDDGTEVARVLDSGAAWNTVVTKLWFRTTDAMLVAGTQRFWLYYDNPGATAPPASPGAVFLFAEDFENGLGAWTVDNGVTTSNTRAHRGTRAVQLGPLAQVVNTAFVTGLNERDVAYDVWWNIDDVSGVDAFAAVRYNQGVVYFTNLQPSGNGPGSRWDISRNVNAMFDELVAPPPNAPPVAASTWTRVTMYAYQSSIAVDINDARYVPASGFATMPDAPTGAVGLGGYTVPSRIWFDDATVRRFVIPEPAITLGPAESLP